MSILLNVNLQESFEVLTDDDSQVQIRQYPVNGDDPISVYIEFSNLQVLIMALQDAHRLLGKTESM